MLKHLTIALLAIVALAGPAQAQRMAEWEILGQQRVGFGVDRDVIRVGAKDGTFTTLQLRVRENEIEVLDLKVRYGNGEVEDLRVASRIRPGGSSGAIDLRGRARIIESVQLIYRSRPNFRGQAVVELWGRRVGPAAGGPGPGFRPPGPGPSFGFPGAPSGKWERLGSKSVGFLVDRDTIPVGGQEGRFRKILLRVLNNDVDLMDVRVVYGNGEPDNLTYRKIVRAGGHSGVLDLRGQARAIQRVELTYKSKPSFRGLAVVELWGLHD